MTLYSNNALLVLNGTCLNNNSALIDQTKLANSYPEGKVHCNLQGPNIICIHQHARILRIHIVHNYTCTHTNTHCRPVRFGSRFFCLCGDTRKKIVAIQIALFSACVDTRIYIHARIKRIHIVHTCTSTHNHIYTHARAHTIIYTHALTYTQHQQILHFRYFKHDEILFHKIYLK